MSARVVALIAVLLAPVVLAAAPGAAPSASVGRGWPDGCVDRVDGRRVVVVGPTGVEQEIVAPADEVPREGACFEAGRLDPALTERLRARSEQLLRALAEALPTSDRASEPEVLQ